MVSPPLSPVQPSARPPVPAPNEPGTLGEQFAAIGLSLYLGSRRKTSARDAWDDARRLVMPHAREDRDL